MAEAFLIIFVLVCLVLGVFAWAKDYADSRRPYEVDRVAERKRKLDRNGFKSRMGAR
jgi:hypothetical protein